MRAVGGAHGALAGKGGFMKKVYGLLAGLMIVAMLTGCGGSTTTTIDENKPVSQIAADASKMGKAELQTMVTKYEAAIADKSKEVEALMAKVKEIPITEMMGEKAKALKDDVSKLKTSIDKLKDQMAVYAKELAAKK
jgi:Skp family chaperone for outer membrane proteins